MKNTLILICRMDAAVLTCCLNESSEQWKWTPGSSVTSWRPSQLFQSYTRSRPGRRFVAVSMMSPPLGSYF